MFRPLVPQRVAVVLIPVFPLSCEMYMCSVSVQKECRRHTLTSNTCTNVETECDYNPEGLKKTHVQADNNMRFQQNGPLLTTCV